MDSLNRGELQVDEQQEGNNNEHEAAGQEAHGYQAQNELGLLNNGEVAVLGEAQGNVADESSVKIEVHVGTAANDEIESLLQDEVQLENLSNIEAMPELSFENEAGYEEETHTNENGADSISTLIGEVASGSEIEGAACSECAVIFYPTDKTTIESALNSEATSDVSHEDDAAANQEETYSDNDPNENDDAISSHSEREDGPEGNADDISSDSECEGASGGPNVILFHDSDEEELYMSFSQAKFPIPIQSDPTPDDFVKRENDRLSGNKPFRDGLVRS